MAELQRAWDRINAAVYSKEGCYQVYSEWADTYESDSKLVQCSSNEELAQQAIKVFENEDSSQLLDVAAGTGLMGQAMRNAGFRGIIDGIDLSEDMLEKAKEKGIYRNLISQGVVPDSPLPVKDNSYDAITMCGGIVINHMEPGCLVPILTALKPGGWFVFNTRDSQENSHIKNKIEEILEEMAKEEKIKFERKKVYHFRSQTVETGDVMHAVLYIVNKL